MNNLKYFFAFIFIFSYIFQSCDVIDGPFTEEIIVEECEDECKKILLEDYTGHKCGNCPRAAEKAEELKEIYGDQLIPIAIHAGFFASNFGGNFTTDFTSSTGNEWDAFFGNSAAGNPNGMINRVGYPSSDHIIQHSQWAQKVDELLQSDAQIYIEIETEFNASSNSVTIESTTEILESISGPLSLNVIVTESHIIAYQTDYEADPQEIADYEHNHVMRKSLTGSWGVDLGQSNYNNGDVISNTFSLTIDEDWVVENMSVVAFISNTNSYEVIQAEETYIME